VVTNPVLVALDLSTGDEAEAMARRVLPHVGGFKVGLELLMAEGPEVVGRIGALGLPVFADVKLHDIPNTVGRAMERLGRMRPRWVTVHASGGEAMVRAAVEGLASADPGAGVLAVTVLTSLTDEDLASIGVAAPARDQVSRLTEVSAAAGAEGVVCSVAEVSVAKRAAPALITVTPGVRPAGSAVGDQRRVATPEEAVRAGSDYLVIGRPITRANDPAAAAEAIAADVMDPRVLDR